MCVVGISHLQSSEYSHGQRLLSGGGFFSSWPTAHRNGNSGLLCKFIPYSAGNFPMSNRASLIQNAFPDVWCSWHHVTEDQRLKLSK